MELSEQEKSLLEILRNFGFLTQYGYVECEFSFFIRAFPTVRFKNHQLNQVVSVIGADCGCGGSNYSVVIERRRLFSYKLFDISDYYGKFGVAMIKGKNYSLNTMAEFMKNNFIPVLKGERWINQDM